MSRIANCDTKLRGIGANDSDTKIDMSVIPRILAATAGGSAVADFALKIGGGAHFKADTARRVPTKSNLVVG
jgi:hypothetical protein